jgi:2-oxo-4-hydroxy-4-carboxy-5-ureidoimidazoline decarboxylase
VLKLHPELSGKEAVEGTLTKFSVTEQSGLGLNQLPKEDYLKIRDFNRRYREKFGFPFVVCVRLLKNRDELYAAQESRFNNTAETELRKGIEQVYEIARLRLETLIEVTK